MSVVIIHILASVPSGFPFSLVILVYRLEVNKKYPFCYKENFHGKTTVFIHINAPGAMHFSKGGGGGGATITDTKTQLSSQVAMGDNGHLQP